MGEHRVKVPTAFRIKPCRRIVQLREEIAVIQLIHSHLQRQALSRAISATKSCMANSINCFCSTDILHLHKFKRDQGFHGVGFHGVRPHGRKMFTTLPYRAHPFAVYFTIFTTIQPSTKCLKNRAKRSDLFYRILRRRPPPAGKGDAPFRSKPSSA